MNFPKLKIYLFMLIMGFIFISLDIDIETGMKYQNEYSNTNQVIGEFQYYNIASNYNAGCTYKYIDSGKDNTGADSESLIPNQNITSPSAQKGTKVIDKIYFKNIKIDIFNDIIGFLLIGAACIGLRKSGSRFKFAALTSLIAIILHSVIAILPFMVNGLILCNFAMILGLAKLGCSVLTTFLFVSGLLNMCTDVCCRDERKWCRMIWFITCVLQILVTFVLWLGSDFKLLYNLGLFFEYVLTGFIIIFWIVLKRAYDYIEKTYNNTTMPQP